MMELFRFLWGRSRARAASALGQAFPNMLAAMWWSTTALTTVGYGDIYPITPGGKVAWVGRHARARRAFGGCGGLHCETVVVGRFSQARDQLRVGASPILRNGCLALVEPGLEPAVRRYVASLTDCQSCVGPARRGFGCKEAFSSTASFRRWAVRAIAVQGPRHVCQGKSGGRRRVGVALRPLASNPRDVSSLQRNLRELSS